MAPQDEAGRKTLESVKAATRFNRWMYDTVKENLQGSILEIGSGIGTISAFVLQDDKQLTLSEINDDYLQLLKQQFARLNNAKGFLNINIADDQFEKKYAVLKEQFDSVFLLNVLEHVTREKEAVNNCRYLLKAGGTLVILVPAYQSLYSRLDESIGHFRRYTKKTLKSLFSPNDFAVKRCFYFNALGMAGWLWNKVSGKEEIETSKMKLFDKLVLLAKVLDKLLLNSTGLSVIAIAEKA